MIKKSRLISTILIICLLFSSVGVFASGKEQNYGQANINPKQGIVDVVKGIAELVGDIIQKFSDIKNNWAVEYIAELYSQGAIAGYPDGTFKPNNSINRAEFTKIMVTSLGEDPGSYKGGHWATNYFSIAREEGYIKEGEFDNPDKAITRGEIARMISRALEETPQDIDSLKNQLTDFAQIGSEYREHVAKVYAAGIITGFPDGSFGAEKTATRAEASTMLVRFLEPDKRSVPELEENKKEEPIKETEDKTFIEPDINVHYFEGQWDFSHFAIGLNNPKDYEGAVEHTFVTECISHPNINLVYAKNIYGEFMSKKIDKIDQQQKISPKFSGGNGIYELFMRDNWKPVEGTFDVKDGDLMQYKVTVSNGKTTKEYIIDINFNDREFY